MNKTYYVTNNALTGYLTEGCPHCPFWHDEEGNNKALARVHKIKTGNDISSIGCHVPVPIIDCPYFYEMYKNDPRNNN